MRTEIAQLGKFGLIERLSGHIPDDGGNGRGESCYAEQSGWLEDAVEIDAPANGEMLLASAMLLEGVDFDLTYFPFRHLGYKAVTVGVSNILAMNGLPLKVVVSLGVSAKLSVEELEELYAGARLACSELGGRNDDGRKDDNKSGRAGGVEFVGGDITASVNGLVISVNVVGTVAPERITRRSGAHEHDLICITRDLGAAYLGLHLLEREKRVLVGSGKGSGAANNPQPKFTGYEYLLERQLKPRARKDIIDALAAANIVPTAMTDIADGLASDLLQICRASHCGARIYLDRLPIARETYALAEELHIDPVVAALNGGDDRELLFTVPLAAQEQVSRLGHGIEIIGHITAEATGAALTTPDGSDIPLRAQGFNN
jgi:thiamine-monophosphate kinase